LRAVLARKTDEELILYRVATTCIVICWQINYPFA